jgi:hypothetical protein
MRQSAMQGHLVSAKEKIKRESLGQMVTSDVDPEVFKKLALFGIVEMICCVVKVTIRLVGIGNITGEPLPCYGCGCGCGVAFPSRRLVVRPYTLVDG